jgi:ADP-ribose pyrophosphatase
VNKPYNIIDTRTVHQDKILTLCVDRFNEHGGPEKAYTRLELGDWINVVPLTEHHELIIIRQYRHGAGIWTVEVPAGKIDHGETPMHAAYRELEEETGIKQDSLISLGTFFCNPALQNNRTHTFLAYPVTPIAGFNSSEGDAVLIPRSEWESDAFLTADGNLFSTAALLLAQRFLRR